MNQLHPLGSLWLGLICWAYIKTFKFVEQCDFCFSFCLGFVLWWVFFLYAFFELIKVFITNNLIIIYKLSTIESLYYKERVFTTILVFLDFCHNLRKIAKEKENININIKKYVLYVWMCQYLMANHSPIILF
jgi:hypothetical protein